MFTVLSINTDNVRMVRTRKGYENMKSYIDRLHEYETKKQAILSESKSQEDINKKLKKLAKELKL